jgi:hypothetical protein
VSSLARARRTAKNTAAAADEKKHEASRATGPGTTFRRSSAVGGNGSGGVSNGSSRSGRSTYSELLAAKREVALLLDARQAADEQWQASQAFSARGLDRGQGGDGGAEGTAAAAASVARQRHSAHLQSLVDFLRAPPSLATARAEGLTSLLQTPPGVSALDDWATAEAAAAASAAAGVATTVGALANAGGGARVKVATPPPPRPLHPARIAAQRTVAALRAERPWWCASLPEDLSAAPRDVRRLRAGHPFRPRAASATAAAAAATDAGGGARKGRYSQGDAATAPSALAWPFQEWREGEAKAAGNDYVVEEEEVEDEEKEDVELGDAETREGAAGAARAAAAGAAAAGLAAAVDDAEASKWWYAWARRMPSVDAATGRVKVNFLDVVDAAGRSQVSDRLKKRGGGVSGCLPCFELYITICWHACVCVHARTGRGDRPLGGPRPRGPPPARRGAARAARRPRQAVGARAHRGGGRVGDAA